MIQIVIILLIMPFARGQGLSGDVEYHPGLLRWTQSF